MNHLLLIAFSFILFQCQYVFAQGSVINGEVSSEDGYEMGVMISLNLTKDSTVYKITFSDSVGNFVLNQIDINSYYISAQLVGFEYYFSKEIVINELVDTLLLPQIILEESVTSLAGVEISARIPFIVQMIDRVVIRPDALISNSGTTALEVLEKAPGVLVDVNGNISLKGKSGVNVFIDNKPSYLSANDLTAYLQSLPSGIIEKIELMTNPPAGYEAAGNAGIINIQLKRNKQKGVNGSLTLNYGQGRYLRSNNSFNINYRINKINLYSNIGFSQNNNYQDLAINRFYNDDEGKLQSTFSQNSYFKLNSGGRNLRLGLDYYIDKKSTFGLLVSGFINPSKVKVTNNATILNSENELVNQIKAVSKIKNKWKNGSISINYDYKFDKEGRLLNANLDYINYRSKQPQTLLNSIYSPQNELISQSILTSELPSTISIVTGKLDYTQPIKYGIKLESGAKVSFVSTDNIAIFSNVVDEISIPNYEFSNQFKYAENINAAYLNLSKDWKKTSLQLGLRLENSNIKGNQLGNVQIKDSTFTRHYTNLFPTFYATYKIDSAQNHQLAFSFGRRINRPNYQDMNPFTYPMDSYTYYAGNPFLKPSFSYNFSLSHTFKSFLTTSIEYSLTNDLIQETNEQRGNIYYSRPGNFGRQKIYGVSVSGKFEILPWWSLQIYSEAKNIFFNSLVYGQDLNESKWYWYFMPTNQFKIGKTTSIELSGSYQTRILSGQFLTIPIWQIRTGISQKIFKQKGTLRLNVSDIFYTNQPGGDIRDISNSSANWLSYLDSRVISLSFSYRFNKGDFLTARQSGSSDDEKQRIKFN